MTHSPDTAVRIVGFRSLLNGAPATLTTVAAQTDLSVSAIRDAASQLDSRGALELDGETIVGAHGVTTRTSPHSFDYKDHAVHTWCALDAIGIPAALALDSTVRTTCPICGRDLSVAVDRGEPNSTTPVIFLPTATCSNLTRDFCAVASMFCGTDHLEQWTTQHGDPEGRSLTLAEAADLGRSLWADVTTP